jgi:small subunit ribosomal protein S6
MFIIAPTLAPDAYDRLVQSFEAIITENGGTVTNTIKWGLRTFAYDIQNFKEGIYTIFEFEAPGELIKELERRMRLNDSILKYLTTKTERKTKLVNKGTEKRKAQEDTRKKRKAVKSN